MWRNRVQTVLVLVFFLSPVWSHLVWRISQQPLLVTGEVPPWMQWALTAQGMPPTKGVPAALSLEVQRQGAMRWLDYTHLLRGDTLLGTMATGWTGGTLPRTVLAEGDSLPADFVRLYREVYGEIPLFPDGAVYLTNHTDSLVVLLPGKDLTDPLPRIATPLNGQQEFGVPAFVRLPSQWALTACARPEWVVSYVELPLTPRGKEILRAAGLPYTWPVLVAHPSRKSMVFTLNGDQWTPAPWLSHLSGIRLFRKFFYNNKDPYDPRKVFWEYTEAFFPTWASQATP
jgi:hypothetical protein